MIDALGILATAEHFARDTTAIEGIVRAAISRAYYSPYHYLCDKVHRNVPDDAFRVLFGASKSGRPEIPHRFLSETLADSANPQVAEAGRRLSKLKWMRVEADYFLGLNLSIVEARAAIAQARELIAHVQSWSNADWQDFKSTFLAKAKAKP